MKLFDRKRGPDKVFEHGPDCKTVAVDRDVQIPWSYMGNGRWEAVCTCGTETWYEPAADRRVRLDPRDPALARHPGQCEFASETDAAVLRILLKVKEGAGGDYWWVECGGCDCAWPVPRYAAESVG